MAEFNYAKVYILEDMPYGLDREYDYSIPYPLRPGLDRGVFVSVPFGPGNIRKLAVITELKEKSDLPKSKIKPMQGVYSGENRLTEEQFGLCMYLKETTLCTFGEAVHTVIPCAAMTKAEEFFRLTDNVPDLTTLLEESVIVYKMIEEYREMPFRHLRDACEFPINPPLHELYDNGYITSEIRFRDVAREVFKEFYSLADGVDIKKVRGDKQKATVNYLSENGESDKDVLIEKIGVTGAYLKTLTEKGLICRRRAITYREPFFNNIKHVDTDHELNEEQTIAFEKLRDMAATHEPRAALLYGVTGSGKTSVMIKLIDEVLASGRGVIVMIPEIALTPQTVAIFFSRYGDKLALVHSGLSMGERLDAFNKIKRGQARIVVGTRSAVFSPVVDLGLIIMDEEQEHTYKSDADPKYHARDVARYRAAHENALMLLCSATPSIESYKKAMDGQYELLTLKKRYGGTPLPKVSVIDMREEAFGGNVTPIGYDLTVRLKEVVAENKQAILFLNRRGYHNFVSCRVCGAAIKCPHCSVSMHFHAGRTGIDDGELVCHWCGTRIKQPTVCPECGSRHLVRMGYGTQWLEKAVADATGDDRVIRMDADTTNEKSAYENMISSFRDHKADILIGTQMVTKGHDFPDVGLVGVLLADASLYYDDYRANERTFAMLTQVIGRAGRRNSVGEAIIQTNNPDNDVIKLACEQNYEKFYENEIRLRRNLVFPPFCDIVLITVVSWDDLAANNAATDLREKMNKLLKEEYKDVPTYIFGPVEAPVYKVENKFRVRLVIKCKINKRSREFLSRILREGTPYRAASISMDINPSGL